MGFFSYECVRCHRPLLSQYAITPGVNAWMQDVVALRGTQLFAGQYDGYGRLVGATTHVIKVDRSYHCHAVEELYHYDCWVLAGRPREQSVKKSLAAVDQGWFFAPGVYDLPSPPTED